MSMTKKTRVVIKPVTARRRMSQWTGEGESTVNHFHAESTSSESGTAESHLCHVRRAGVERGRGEGTGEGRGGDCRERGSRGGEGESIYRLAYSRFQFQ